MRYRLPVLWLLLLSFTVSIIVGCSSSFEPRSPQEINFQERSQTQVDGSLRVTAAVLSADETKAVFGFALYKKGIQPIWLEIENKDEKPTWFLPYSVDPDYFPPLEVTYPYHRTFDSDFNDQIDRYFLDHAMGFYLAPGSVRSGFVFTNLDLGTKSFNVDLVGEDKQAHTLTFFIAVPGLRSDHQDVDFDNLYSASEKVSYNADDFRKALRELPCCVTNKDGSKLGAPINFVIVADDDKLLRVLIRAGWNETATTNTASSSKKDISSDIPQDLRYKPVAPLYYYGRQQDASFREPRAAGFERNKLRLWLSPIQFEGQAVWVGQINRDYGKQSSGRLNRKIDLDEARSFFLQNLWYAQGIKQYGFVKGAGTVSPIGRPKMTFRGLTYITDGYRAVLWLSAETVPLSEIKALEWELPPER
jgi:hypothetical protein